MELCEFDMEMNSTRIQKMNLIIGVLWGLVAKFKRALGFVVLDKFRGKCKGRVTESWVKVKLKAFAELSASFPLSLMNKRFKVLSLLVSPLIFVLLAVIMNKAAAKLEIHFFPFAEHTVSTQ